MLLHLVVDQVRVVHVGAERHRSFRIERRVRVAALSEESADGLRVVEALEPPLLMAGQEPVVSDDNRQADIRVLADPDGGEVQVVDGLRVSRHQDDPAGVEDEVDVGMVAADIQRPGHGAGGHVQHHRDTGAGLHRQLLQRIQQPLRRRRVEHATAAERCAVADAGGAVLAVGGDHDDVVFAVGLHLRQAFGHFRRRRYREVAHHVKADITGREGGGLVAALKILHLPHRLAARG